MTPAAADNLELVVGIYPQEENSKWVLKSLERLQRERALVLVSTAVLVKTDSGQLLTRQIVDWNLTEGGMIDGLTASLVSLLNPAGSLGAVALNAGGLSVEVLLDHLAEIGLARPEIEAFAQRIKPGCSILIALTKHRYVKRLTTEMSHFETQLIHRMLSPFLRANLGEHLISLAQAVVLEQSQQTARFDS